jgi:alkanesulfonate monooxygenase SsuD/methylene tetrahydromethanopterin reductase-like flavin-dependent oxidoreductase (luciferase family)
MNFGISIKNGGKFSDIEEVIGLAIDAEEAGWDGFFPWDHIIHVGTGQVKMFDPWIVLAGVAASTKKIKLGPMITPLARRRPWKVARETVTLDHLSKGRLILGVGLGATVNNDFERFGEERNPKIRAEKLDESLDILQGLWKGEPFGYQGKHYSVAENTTFKPQPYGIKTKIPIWVGGGSWSWSSKPFQRAARFEGTFPEFKDKDGEKVAQYYERLANFIKKYRGSLEDFDFVNLGKAPRRESTIKDYFKPIIESSVLTWWVERVYQWKGEISDIRKRIREGPPQID